MNTTAQHNRLKVTLLVVVLASMIFLPMVLYWGIASVLILVFAAAGVQHVVALLRPQPHVSWKAGTMVRFRMSRLSRMVVGLWMLYVAAHLLIRFFLKLPSSDYYLAAHAVFALLVAVTRWLDSGRLSR